MARSRVRGTNGQPRKKNKNRDSLRASIRHTSDSRTDRRGNSSFKGKSEYKNDGNPTVTYSGSHTGPDGIKKKYRRKAKDPSAACPVKGKSCRKFLPPSKTNHWRGSNDRATKDEIRSNKAFIKRHQGRYIP